MERIGKIGLPIIEIADADPSTQILRRFQHNMHLAYFFSKIDETEVGRAYSEKLRNDPRVKALEGRMLRNGTSAGIFQFEQLLYWLLWRANEVDSERAAMDLDSYLDSEEVDILHVLWVYGLKPATSFKLPNDVMLVPIELMLDSGDKAEFQILGSPATFGRSPAPAAALVKRFRQKKLQELNYVPSASDPVFIPQRQLQDLALLLNCVPNVVCTPAYGTSYFPAEVPIGPFGGSGGSSPIFDVLPREFSLFPTGQETLISSLVSGYEKLSGDSHRRIQQGLRRFSQAKSRSDAQDKLLDLGISLEMLLLGGEHGRKEIPDQLSLTFRLRGSWLLGKTGAHRRALYKILREIYSLRSQVAHNGFSLELAKMEYNERQKAIKRYFEVGEQVFQRLIIDGNPTDWTAILLQD